MQLLDGFTHVSRGAAYELRRGQSSISVSERLRPRRPFHATAAEMLVTREGEYAVMQSDGEVTSAIVHGDDFRVEIIGRGAELRPIVRALVEGFELGLGDLRWRRFLYTPPPGWTGGERGLVNDWYAPDFPAEVGVLVVPPAKPIAAALRLGVGKLGELGVPFKGAVEDRRVVRIGPFSGWRGTLRGRCSTTGAPRAGDLLVLEDGRYCYPLRLDSAPEHLGRHREAFEAVAASIVPLPRPVAHGYCTQQEHWVD